MIRQGDHVIKKFEHELLPHSSKSSNQNTVYTGWCDLIGCFLGRVQKLYSKVVCAPKGVISPDI